MDNIFDQFDTQTQQPTAPDQTASPSANVFDQFDPPAEQPVTQMTGALREPAIAGSNIIKGLGQISGLPGDAAQLYNNFVGAPFARVMSGQSPQFGTGDQLSTGLAAVLPPSSKITNDLTNAGVVDRPDLQPQGVGENILASGARGVGATGPFAAMGGSLAAAANLLAQGAGSGIGGDMADKYLPDWMPGKQLVGGMLGGGVAGGLESLAQRGISAATGASSPILDAYKEAGVTPRLVGDVSGNTNMQQMQAYASKAPFGAGQVKAAAEKTLDEFGSSVENTAAQMGSSHTLQEAGQAVQNSGKQWLKDFDSAQNSAWTDVSSTIGKTAPVAPTNTMNSVNTLTLASAGNPALSDALKSPTLQKVINVLQDAKGQPLTWEQTEGMRTLVGQQLQKPQLIADPGEMAQAKLIYSSLTKDMEAAALASGNVAGLAKFRAANALTSQGHQFVGDVLSGVMRANPEDAASALLSSGAKGGTQLQAIRAEMPDAADELGAVSIRRSMAGPSEGASGNTVSPSRWLSNQDPTRRLSPEAYKALYPNPAVQSKMAALDKVANSMRETEQFVNRANTGGSLENAAMWTAAPVIGEAARLGYEAGGVPGAIGGGALASVPYLSGPISGRLATSPALARLMATPAVDQPWGSSLPRLATMLK